MSVVCSNNAVVSPKTYTAGTGVGPPSRFVIGTAGVGIVIHSMSITSGQTVQVYSVTTPHG